MLVSRKQYETVTGKGSTLEAPPTPPIVKYSLLVILSIASLLTISIFCSSYLRGFYQNMGS